MVIVCVQLTAWRYSPILRKCSALEGLSQTSICCALLPFVQDRHSISNYLLPFVHDTGSPFGNSLYNTFHIDQFLTDSPMADYPLLSDLVAGSCSETHVDCDLGVDEEFSSVLEKGQRVVSFEELSRCLGLAIWTDVSLARDHHLRDSL